MGCVDGVIDVFAVRTDLHRLDGDDVSEDLRDMTTASTISLIEPLACYAGANDGACSFNFHPLRLWAAP